MKTYPIHLSNSVDGWKLEGPPERIEELTMISFRSFILCATKGMPLDCCRLTGEGNR
jgi:hypothetical protein